VRYCAVADRPTPSEFAFTFHLRRDLALRYAKGLCANSRRSTRPTGQPKRQERNHRWIKPGGKVSAAKHLRILYRDPNPIVSLDYNYPRQWTKSSQIDNNQIDERIVTRLVASLLGTGA
jgi:hypothetical protein